MIVRCCTRRIGFINCTWLRLKEGNEIFFEKFSDVMKVSLLDENEKLLHFLFSVEIISRFILKAK